jgi:hypothetical protein
MAARRPWPFLIVWLIPSTAGAGHHKFDVFIAPSYLHGTGSSFNLGGWHVSGAATLGEKHSWLGLVGDVSVHSLGGGEADFERTQVTFLAGPRFTVTQRHRMRNVFGHAVVLGAVQRTGGSTIGPTTAGAVAIGGGYDRSFAKGDKWALRLQVDYVQPVSSDMGHSWRVSVGAAYRGHFKSE